MIPAAAKLTMLPLPSASPHLIRSSAALATCLLVASCGSIPMPSALRKSAPETVVYALGPREGYTSPLAGSLKPACPALVFEGSGFTLSSAHQEALRGLAGESLKTGKKTRLLIAGYTPPGLPADHARSLSERRALAVRQQLIKLGLEAAQVQTVGFGNDFSPTGPSSDVVVIYLQ